MDFTATPLLRSTPHNMDESKLTHITVSMLSSFIISFHSFRIDNLLQTIRFLESNHPDVVAHSELILLCQDQISPIKSSFANTQTVCMHLPNMQKCKAINHGAKLAAANKIILLDSDRILPPGYFLKVLTTLQPKTVVSARTTHRLTRMATDQEINEVPFKLEPRKHTNIFSGNASFYVSDYWAAGGMNEKYIGYGWEDDDMSQRMLHSRANFVYREEIEIHLHHHRDSYGTGDQKIMYLNNGIRFHSEWNLPIEAHLREELNDYTKDLI
jgi:hypothetical protein